MQVIVSLKTQNKSNKSAARAVKTRACIGNVWRSVTRDGDQGTAVH